MRVIHVSHSDLSGGAARAAFRIHCALASVGVESEMVVLDKRSDDPAVRLPAEGSVPGSRIARRRLGNLLLRTQRSAHASYRSLNWLYSRLANELNASKADLVNLHWVGLETMSIADVGRIRKPVVWTMHDMWPFSGAEHYPPDTASARFRTGYRSDNRPTGSAGLDIDRWTWKRKKAHWRPMHLVAPSRWLAQCAGESVLMAGWPLEVIPNPVDMSVFSPNGRDEARRAIGIAPQAKLILFGADGGIDDPRKGFRHLISAMRQLTACRDERLAVGIFGGECSVREGFPAYEVHDIGRIDDESRLAEVYAAADVFVAPSEMDNLPNTVVESLACGTPVVAFQIGGLPDMLRTGREGYLARPYDPSDLAVGIRWVLNQPARDLRHAARSRAEALFDPSLIGRRYRDVYGRACGAAA